MSPPLPQQKVMRLIGSILFLGYIFVCCQSALLAPSNDGGNTFGASSRVLRVQTPLNTDAADAIAEAAARAELGKSTWHFFHRVAAAFDKEPTLERSREMVTFFTLAADFFPCPECAKHFRELIKHRPIDASDNRALSLWLCAVHNEVNQRLSKPIFTCTLDALKERWGKCGCFDINNETSTTTTTMA